MKNVIGITEDKLHPKAEDVFENEDIIPKAFFFYYHNLVTKNIHL
jgi:hypothetical protein